mgnify:CR=1 FL=1
MSRELLGLRTKTRSHVGVKEERDWRPVTIPSDQDQPALFRPHFFIIFLLSAYTFVSLFMGLHPETKSSK